MPPGAVAVETASDATTEAEDSTEPSLGLTDSWPAPERAATPNETESKPEQGSSTAGANRPATKQASSSSSVTSASSPTTGASASSTASSASTSQGSNSRSATPSTFTNSATSSLSGSTGSSSRDSDDAATNDDASADSETSSTGTGGTTAGAETGTTGSGSDATGTDDTTGTDSSGDSDGSCGSIPYDEAWLKQKLSELTGAVDTTLMGVPVRLGPRYTVVERFTARAWLAQEYSKLGYTLRPHNYRTGVNAFAERKGTGEGVLVISAHLDTRQGTPGADDDGTGIITGLAIAAAFARCQPEKTVRFMAFDEEEQGTRGSYAYISSLKRQRRLDEIEGVIQVEMTGYDNNNDGGLAKVDCGNQANRALSNALESAIRTHSIDLKTTSYCARGSDHAAFWDSRVPAMTVSQLFFRPRPSTNEPDADRNPCYHAACDTVDKLNFEYMNKVARALTYTAIDLSGAK